MKKLLTVLLMFTFVFALSACKPAVEDNTDAADALDAATKLSLDVTDVLAITQDIDLPTAGLHSSVITWASNNTAVIANDGTVTRPAIDAGDATVILTATITIGDAVETKTFTVKVLESVPTLAMDIATFNSSAVDSGDTVEITGVVIGTIDGKGFHIADATGFTYVYENQEATPAIGDNVTVTGEKTIYLGVREVSWVTSIVINSSDNTLPAFTASTMEAIYAAGTPELTSFANPFYNTMVTVNGYVTIEGSNNNAFLSWYDTDLNLYKMEVYYKSGSDAKIAEIKALVGKLITIDAIVYDYYASSPSGYRFSVNTPGAVTEIGALTDQQKANLAAANVDLGNIDFVIDDVTLPAENTDFGATFAWASSDETAVTTDGVVTLPEGADQTVTLTLTVTVGTTTTAVKTFDLILKDALALTPLTVSEALAETDGPILLVEGIVIGTYLTWGDNEVVLQDPVTGEAIYVDFDVTGAVIGDKVVVRGELETYTSYSNNKRQIDSGSLVEIIDHDNAIIVDTETDVAVIADAFADMLVYTTTLTVKSFDTYGYVFFNGSATRDLKFNIDTYAPYFKDVYAIGDTVVATFTVMDIDHDHTRVVNVQLPALTEAQNMLAAKGALEVVESTIVDLDLPLANADYNATISWATDDAAVITAAGVVTRPAIGEPAGSVTLTASVTVGTVTETVDFVVAVPAETPPALPLFISEYIEGSSNNKAIEIYNPNAFDVVMTGYAVNTYSGGATEASYTFDLSSYTILAGDVFVISNSSAVAGISDESDATSSITYYNGDDAVELALNGTTVDVIGEIGVDPGTYWTVLTGTTAEYTLVRASSVTAPNTVFTEAEWVVYPQDTFTYIGTHTVD